MRSTNKKLSQNVTALAKALGEHEKLSVAEIMELLQCNKKSVYNYLGRLAEAGFVLQRQQTGHTVYYSFEKNGSGETAGYVPMSLDILRKYTVIQKLQDGMIDKDALRSKFTVYQKGDELKGSASSRHYNTKTLLDVRLTKYYSLIKELEEAQELTSRSGKYCLTGKGIPLQLRLSEDDLYNINEALITIPRNNPYYKQLHKIWENTTVLIGDPGDRFQDSFILYGRKNTRMQHITDLMHKLDKADYTRFITRIDYLSRQGRLYRQLFKTGLIVYSEEKDTLYLLGESRDLSDDGSWLPTIIDAESIQYYEETRDTHRLYHSQPYLDRFDTMFGVSMDEPENVTVMFENTGSIKRKLQILDKQRKHARLEYKDNMIIYRDCISGMGDFAAYLRRFGKSVRVEEPAALKYLMERGVTRALKRYGETWWA